VGGATDAGRPSWLRLLEPDGTATALAASGGAVPEGVTGRTIVLGEKSDRGWKATLDGVPLDSADAGWQQGFTLPPEGGFVEVSYRTDPLVGLQLALLLLMVLTALPLRRRRSEESES
jgi:hypothetical protein